MNLYRSNKKGGTMPTGNKAITIDSVGTTSGIDVANYATASVTTDGLYKPSGTCDLGTYTTNGTKNPSTDISAYKYVKWTNNVSASLSETTLWTNSSPTSGFAAQSVTLPSSYSNYDYLKIEFRATTSDSTTCSALIPKDVLSSGVSPCAAIGCQASGSSVARAVSIESSTSIHFTGSYILAQAGQTVNNNRIIPTKISGLS